MASLPFASAALLILAGCTSSPTSTRADGCPTNMPNDGDACSVANPPQSQSPPGPVGVCGYTTDTNACGAVNCYCMNQVWQCNPTCIIRDASAADQSADRSMEGGAAEDSTAGDASASDAACNAGGADGGMCVPGTTPPYVSCADLTTPTVSYAASIQPVFNSSCAIAGGTCHGDPNTNPMTTGQIYLGNAGGVLAGLVGKPSPEDPQMDLVAPGDPAHSFLMHKLDGDQCLYAAQCNATHNPIFTNCGVQEPYNSGVLDLATRDTIRRWIAQGAQNN